MDNNMCRLMSLISSNITNVLRNMKSTMLAVTVLLTSSLAVVAQAEDINLTVTVPDGATSVRMAGAWWQDWAPDQGPVAVDNGDNTFTVTMAAPAEDMEYLWVVDGTQENLITNAAVGQCADEITAGAFNTDYANYANRKWLLGSGDATDTYNECSGVASSLPASPSAALPFSPYSLSILSNRPV